MNLFDEDLPRSNLGRLGRLGHFIARHRWQVPPIMKGAGHKSRPQAPRFASQCGS
jgi:hypothetical protein